MRKTWEMVPLGNLLSERQEKPSEEALASGKIRIVAKIGFDDGKIQLRVDGQTKTGMILIRPGDLVVSGINAAKGAIALYGEENSEPIAATIHYGAYISQKNKINVNYLWWLLRSRAFRDILQEYVPGGIKTELKAKRLLPVPIPLPPLSEQERIVAKIEQLAAKVEEARGVRILSNRAIAALYEAGSTQCFSFGTDSTRVGDFAKVVGGYAFKSDLYDENGSYQIVRIGNVRDGYLDLTRSPVYWNYRTDDARISKYLLAENDLVISMTGTRNKRDYGYVAIVPASQKLLLNQRVGKIELKADIDTRYMFHFLRSRFFRDRLFPNATGTANQANIGNEHIEQIPFAFPSFDEQRRIVAYLDGLQAQVDRLKALQAQTAAELEALLPSILDQAFKGAL